MFVKLLAAVFLLTVPLGLCAQERHYVSYGGTAGFQATVWAMKDLGTFEKYGLNGDVVLVGGSARQIQGVLGGSTDFAQVDITAVVSANLKGADLVVVGGTMNKLPFSMVTQPEIREPSQLKGKKIGVVNMPLLQPSTSGEFRLRRPRSCRPAALRPD
jgi:ABC-type nitrate/sulfonate/bicarbonate transport system substrate-binding protein